MLATRAAFSRAPRNTRPKRDARVAEIYLGVDQIMGSEIHMSGWGNLQVCGATPEDTSEYYEKGLLAPGLDYDAPHPYLRDTCDRIDPAVALAASGVALTAGTAGAAGTWLAHW